MRWIATLGVVLVLVGCAHLRPSREAVDLEAYSMCLRTGGQWWPDEQFGGLCLYQAPGFD